MKVKYVTILSFLIVILLSHCEGDEPTPNENWVVGGRWIDTRDGHPYATVPIGDQIWMATNLAYLPSVNNVADGSEDDGKEEDPFYYVYDYDGTDVSAAKATSEYEQYGVLYNWTAAMGACPDGWHLPTDIEWMDLEIYLGMSSNEVTNQGYRGTDQGNRIKATWGWKFDTSKDKFGNGNNDTGFTALPGGERWNEFGEGPGDFFGSLLWGSWWSATKITYEDITNSWYRELVYHRDNINRSQTDIENALYVRCLKN
jgi:uncharacterized protein (TIGR02145 family)